MKWVKEPWHCPNCGLEAVWSNDLDDYYVGVGYACMGCKCYWHMPGSVCEAPGSIRKEMDLIDVPPSVTRAP